MNYMPNKKIILFTTHVWNSKRKAGFHWIASAFWEKGWDVYFVTASLSLFDKLRGDYRFDNFEKYNINNIVFQKERFYTYTIYHPWRPFSRMGKILNRVTYPLFLKYCNISLPGLENIGRQAQLYIFESSKGGMFFERFKLLNPNARFVYRVSDNIHLFKSHPVILDIESKIAPYFDLISVPTMSIYEKFSGLSNVRLQKHGIPINLYEQKHANPYQKNYSKNAIFVGNLFLDVDFLPRASRLFPNIYFHIIGNFKDLPSKPNIISYGEMNYFETIPFIKFADIGLNPRTISSLADSNKMMQYQYCKLPIIISHVDKTDKEFVFYYHYGEDESIYTAIQSALNYERENIPTKEIQSWSSLAKQLAGDLYV